MINNKSILNKFSYHLVMHYKTINYNQLKTLAKRNVECLEIPLILLISLYITDFDNLNADIYSKKDQAIVEKIIYLLEKDLHTKLNISRQDLIDILGKCKNKRLPKLLHNQVCMLVAHENNICYEGDSVKTVDLESLKKVLDSIKYPE